MKRVAFSSHGFLFAWAIILALIPLLLLVYGIHEAHSATEQDADVNLSGSLRYRSLWLYGVLQTQKGEEWRVVFEEMQDIRAELSKRYPQEIAEQDAAWNRFSQSLQTSRRVDWQTANTMRDAADTLTLAIQDRARGQHQHSQIFFGIGICALLLSTSLGLRIARVRHRQEEEQRAAEERFRVLFEHSSDAHLLFDETGITDCNNAAIQMLLCKDKAEVLALHPAVLSPEYQPDGRRSMEKCLEMDATARQNGYHRFEWIHRKTDGTDFPIEVTLTPVVVAGKETLLVVWHDLTERKRAEEKLRHSERRLRDMVEHLPAGAIFVDGERLFANRAVEEITGYRREELPTLDIWFQTIYQERAGEVRAFYEQHKAAGAPDTPIVPIFHKDGFVRQVEFAAYFYETGEVWLLHDRTEHQRAQRQVQAANEWLEEANRELEAQKLALEHANRKLQALATTDGLTGIANHRAFQEQLAEEWQRTNRYGNPFSVILLDVDKFKQYNDSFGHPEGDRVLKIVAQILTETARETDFVARYGGEEFVILLSETGEQGALEAAERFRLAIEQQEWTLRPVTASFGVATLTVNTTSAQELIDSADKALYQSKQAGRNCVRHWALGVGR